MMIPLTTLEDLSETSAATDAPMSPPIVLNNRSSTSEYPIANTHCRTSMLRLVTLANRMVSTKGNRWLNLRSILYRKNPNGMNSAMLPKVLVQGPHQIGGSIKPLKSSKSMDLYWCASVFHSPPKERRLLRSVIITSSTRYTPKENANSKEEALKLFFTDSSFCGGAWWEPCGTCGAWIPEA